MREERGIWGRVPQQPGQPGVPLPLTRATLCITERIQPWSITVQRNTEVWIAGNCWNMVLIWKIPFILHSGCTRITKPCGYATISGWEQIEPVKHMIGPSVNRKCCSPNPQFDFFTRYALFCPKHVSSCLSAHFNTGVVWAAVLTSVDNEEIWVFEVPYSFAFSLPVMRTTAKTNTLLDHFVWELNTVALMLPLCYAICLCLCDCLHPLSRGHSPELTILHWIHYILLSQISKTQIPKRAELSFPRYHASCCVPSFSSLFCLFCVTCSMCFCLSPLISVPWRPDE